MSSKFTLIIFLIASNFIWGQVDSVQHIEEVVISTNVRPVRFLLSPFSAYSLKNIEETQPVDVGEIMQKFAGVNLKSYGGLGGLKTVSVRSLGANHSVFVIDGFPVNNTQTGQVNVGQIQVDNINYIFNSSGNKVDLMLPVSSLVAGNTTSIYTFENSFPRETFQLRAAIKYGSWNTQDYYLGSKWKKNNFFIGLTGKFRLSDGNYPYKLKNGEQSYLLSRENNDYQDYYSGVSAGYRKEGKYSFRLGFRTKGIDQGLPGAVIYYNSTANERLTTKENNVFSDFVFIVKKTEIRWYFNGMNNEMRYVDPDYLNVVGKLDVTYKNEFALTGVSVLNEISDNLKIYAGTEFQYSRLNASDSLFARPERVHNFSVSGIQHRKGKWYFDGQLSMQFVTEKNETGEAANDQWRFNPFAEISFNGNDTKQLTHRLWFRNSFRMPSFNELYYNNIGNLLLKPERANQVNYTFAFIPVKKRLTINTSTSIYFNQIFDKIVAIPTKNLFIWSMQNVGETETYGGEFLLFANYSFNKNWKLSTDINYTLQRTIDVTDRLSPTFGHQIAYIPLHSGNVDVSFYYKKSGMRFSNYMSSIRYALNENIKENIVPGFVLSDISFFHKIVVRKKNILSFQFSIKNFFDESYSFVRSFVMPGRSYLISISYVFN